MQIVDSCYKFGGGYDLHKTLGGKGEATGVDFFPGICFRHHYSMIVMLNMAQDPRL